VSSCPAPRRRAAALSLRGALRPRFVGRATKQPPPVVAGDCFDHKDQERGLAMTVSRDLSISRTPRRRMSQKRRQRHSCAAAASTRDLFRLAAIGAGNEVGAAGVTAACPDGPPSRGDLRPVAASQRTATPQPRPCLEREVHLAPATFPSPQGSQQSRDGSACRR
jgi:hypothetical protein